MDYATAFTVKLGDVLRYCGPNSTGTTMRATVTGIHNMGWSILFDVTMNGVLERVWMTDLTPIVA